MCKLFLCTKNELKIAIQKSGRLHEESMDLLKVCGIQLQSGAGN